MLRDGAPSLASSRLPGASLPSLWRLPRRAPSGRRPSVGPCATRPPRIAVAARHVRTSHLSHLWKGAILVLIDGRASVHLGVPPPPPHALLIVCYGVISKLYVCLGGRLPDSHCLSRNLGSHKSSDENLPGGHGRSLVFTNHFRDVLSNRRFKPFRISRTVGLRQKRAYLP